MKALLFRFRLLPRVRVKLYLIKEERTENNLKDVRAMKIYTPFALLKRLFPNNLFRFARRNHPGDERTLRRLGLLQPVRKIGKCRQEFDCSVFCAGVDTADIEWERRCRAAL